MIYAIATLQMIVSNTAGINPVLRKIHIVITAKQPSPVVILWRLPIFIMIA
jgi:hypothetical protein